MTAREMAEKMIAGLQHAGDREWRESRIRVYRDALRRVGEPLLI